jgi:hypothetical protein
MCLYLYIFVFHQVEFVSKLPGSFEEVVEVELQGRDNIQLRITGNVAKPCLEVLAINDQRAIKCVAFGNTYYGTDRTEQAILYNNGPEVINYVAIVDEEAVAQEMVSIACFHQRWFNVSVF